MDEDLVSRSAVMEIIKDEMEKKSPDMRSILSRIKGLPAAFDMDVVCERIYDATEDYGQGGMFAKLLIDPGEACNILKSGGMA